VTRTKSKPRLRDANGASEYVGGVKTPRWFKDQGRAGLIKAYQIGQTWCFDEADLDELIENSFCDPANYGRSAKAS
jgi:hypothetical protein